MKPLGPALEWGFTERSLKIGSGCFPAQVADHESMFGF